jgi:hypothetical protein
MSTMPSKSLSPNNSFITSSVVLDVEATSAESSCLPWDVLGEEAHNRELMSLSDCKATYWTDRRVCGTPRLPHFLGSRLTSSGEVASFMRRPPFTTKNIRVARLYKRMSEPNTVVRLEGLGLLLPDCSMRFANRVFGCALWKSAVTADFYFNCWCLEIPWNNIPHTTYQDASTIMRKAFEEWIWGSYSGSYKCYLLGYSAM